ncbi:hypothetical protein GCM10010435_00130 [Winogradskya consettensis]|uniref:Uncharacterized protein n=1 Tax=Winogradskya consettensis TaxID=113560 RepID=A0A919T5W6_9ACTN|nr:hypothetical protein [Actinoplanes consettensis]GIM85506.1 hypothetical protein Aco04nite_96590 [Actinoplanes consettensis]
MAFLAVAMAGAFLIQPPRPHGGVGRAFALPPCFFTENPCTVRVVDPVEAPPDETAVVPVPIGLDTDGEECSANMVVATTMPVLSARFATTSITPVEVSFEYVALDLAPEEGADVITSGTTAGPGRTATLDFVPGTLRPGGSYRWRVSGAGDVGQGRPGWSGWCGFTVDPGAPDFSSVDDGDYETLVTLGLLPDRTYSIRLTGGQRQVAAAAIEALNRPDDLDDAIAHEEWQRDHWQRATEERLRVAALIRAANGPAVTLTGPQWAGVVTDLGSWAEILDEGADSEDGETIVDARPYRAASGLIEKKLAAVGTSGRRN